MVSMISLRSLPAALERLFGALAIFNIGAGPVPSDDVPGFVTKRLGAYEEPSIDSIMPPYAGFGFVRFAGGQQLFPFLHQPR